MPTTARVWRRRSRPSAPNDKAAETRPAATRGRPLRYHKVLRILLFIVMLIAPDISDGASPGLWAYHQTIRAAEGAGVIALGSDAIPTDQEPPAGR
jgi:hypothetical protein